MPGLKQDAHGRSCFHGVSCHLHLNDFQVVALDQLRQHGLGTCQKGEFSAPPPPDILKEKLQGGPQKSVFLTKLAGSWGAGRACDPLAGQT